MSYINSITVITEVDKPYNVNSWWSSVDQTPLNLYYCKHGIPRWNATYGETSSRSALFAYTKSILGERNIFSIHKMKYTMGHPDFIVCSFMENSISLKWVDQ